MSSRQTVKSIRNICKLVCTSSGEAAQLHEILVQLLLGTEPVVVGLEAHRRVLAGEDETGGLFAVVGFQQGFRLIGHEGAML